MDPADLPRRRLLRMAAAGIGTAAVAACTDTPAPRSAPGSPTTAAAPAPAPSAAAVRVSTTAGSFASAFLPGLPCHWSLAAPGPPPGSTRERLPVAVFLHGLGGSHRDLLEGMAAGEALQRHLDAGGEPFAVAAVDGGDTWWHPRADGRDAQSMLVKNFVPLLGSRGLDVGRIGLFGFSMGGYGALLLASQGRLPGLRAVAAMSPAVWERYDDRMEGAFDSAADFAAHDIFALRPKLTAVPKRVDCGTGDELLATVRAYVADLPGDVQVSFRPGGHDFGYLRTILPEVLSFLGTHLG